MSTPPLRQRAVDLAELMDDPQCDPRALHRTYTRFALVNRLVSGWRRIYTEQLRPAVTAAGGDASLLDIGTGGGDIPRALARWAARDGLALSITAVDPDARAHSFAAARPPTPGVVFRRTSSANLVAAEERFDIVVSNHVLHHLDAAQLAGVAADSVRLATRLVVHNDIARSVLAYRLYAVGIVPLAPGSFLREDGLRSIRRSYRAEELQAALPHGWRVRRQPPHRLTATWEPGGA